MSIMLENFLKFKSALLRQKLDKIITENNFNFACVGAKPKHF